MSNNGTWGEAFLFGFLVLSVIVFVVNCLASLTSPIWWPRLERWIIDRHQESIADGANAAPGIDTTIRDQTDRAPASVEAVRHPCLQRIVQYLPPFSARDFFRRSSPYYEDHPVQTEASFVQQSREMRDILPRHRSRRVTSPAMSQSICV